MSSAIPVPATRETRDDDAGSQHTNTDPRRTTKTLTKKKKNGKKNTIEDYACQKELVFVLGQKSNVNDFRWGPAGSHPDMGGGALRPLAAMYKSLDFIHVPIPKKEYHGEDEGFKLRDHKLGRSLEWLWQYHKHLAECGVDGLKVRAVVWSRETRDLEPRFAQVEKTGEGGGERERDGDDATKEGEDGTTATAKASKAHEHADTEGKDKPSDAEDKPATTKETKAEAKARLAKELEKREKAQKADNEAIERSYLQALDSFWIKGLREFDVPGGLTEDTTVLRYVNESSKTTRDAELGGIFKGYEEVSGRFTLEKKGAVKEKEKRQAEGKGVRFVKRTSEWCKHKAHGPGLTETWDDALKAFARPVDEKVSPLGDEFLMFAIAHMFASSHDKLNSKKDNEAFRELFPTAKKAGEDSFSNFGDVARSWTALREKQKELEKVKYLKIDFPEVIVVFGDDHVFDGWEPDGITHVLAKSKRLRPYQVLNRGIKDFSLKSAVPVVTKCLENLLKMQQPVAGIVFWYGYKTQERHSNAPEYGQLLTALIDTAKAYPLLSDNHKIVVVGPTPYRTPPKSKPLSRTTFTAGGSARRARAAKKLEEEKPLKTFVDMARLRSTQSKVEFVDANRIIEDALGNKGETREDGDQELFTKKAVKKQKKEEARGEADKAIIDAHGVLGPLGRKLVSEAVEAVWPPEHSITGTSRHSAAVDSEAAPKKKTKAKKTGLPGTENRGSDASSDIEDAMRAAEKNPEIVISGALR